MGIKQAHVGFQAAYCFGTLLLSCKAFRHTGFQMHTIWITTKGLYRSSVYNIAVITNIIKFKNLKFKNQETAMHEC